MPTRKVPSAISPDPNPTSRVGDVLTIMDLVDDPHMDWARPSIEPHAASHVAPDYY